MLCPGNRKLGGNRRIWTFSLPSRSACPGRSPLCERHCYSWQTERRRAPVRLRYQRNLELSRRPDFAARMIAFIRRRRVRVVRAHVGGDFHDSGYARKWLAVMRRCRSTRFFFYTRSWRVPPVRRVLAAMARLDNVRAWFSCDRDAGVPARVPPRVRLAWLMASAQDLPPRADLVFRIRRLRSQVCKRVPLPVLGAALVCPVENGATGHRTSCERCGVCWRPLPASGVHGGPPSNGGGNLPSDA
jgi:hypothetical protein